MLAAQPTGLDHWMGVLLSTVVGLVLIIILTFVLFGGKDLFYSLRKRGQRRK